MSRVYILGAGASAGYANGECGVHPPVARELFKAAQEVFATEGGLSGQSRFNDLWAFLRKYYRVSVNDRVFRRLDIEEVLTMIDIAEAHEARHQLLGLLFHTLDVVIYGRPCEHHARLIENLQPDDAIISFNWDLLVENAIPSTRRQVFTYGTGLLDERRSNPGMCTPNASQGVLVLKLHGSLNWMTCPRCNNKSVAYIWQGKTAVLADVRCNSCQGLTEPLIIPPTLLKKYDHPVLTAVWREALCRIRRADEVVIVGYSLPRTDFKAKWLFMEATVNRAPKIVRLYNQKPDPLRCRFAAAFHVRAREIRTEKGGIKEASIQAGGNQRKQQTSRNETVSGASSGSQRSPHSG